MRPSDGFGFVSRANADLAKPISCAHLRDYIIPFVVLAAVDRTNLSVGEGFPLPQTKAFSTGGETPPLQVVDDVLLSNSDLSVTSPSGDCNRQKPKATRFFAAAVAAKLRFFGDLSIGRF